MPPALTESATALPSVKDWPSGGVLMDGMDGAADTMSVCGTLLAGKYVASPPWLAVMVVLPTPMMVTVLPLTVATEVTELLKLTGSPLLAVAVKLNGTLPTCLPAKTPNAMAWLNRFTVSVTTLLVMLPPPFAITTL